MDYFEVVLLLILAIDMLLKQINHLSVINIKKKQSKSVFDQDESEQKVNIDFLFNSGFV